jgi:hypothetical protein
MRGRALASLVMALAACAGGPECVVDLAPLMVHATFEDGSPVEDLEMVCDAGSEEGRVIEPGLYGCGDSFGFHDFEIYRGDFRYTWGRYVHPHPDGCPEYQPQTLELVIVR